MKSPGGEDLGSLDILRGQQNRGTNNGIKYVRNQYWFATDGTEMSCELETIRVNNLYSSNHLI